MNKNVQTYYAIVSVEEGLPDSEEYMFTIVNGHKNHDYKPFDTGTTHWLSEQQGIILSVEEWNIIEALLKSSEIAARINDLPELAGKIEQALSQLNKE